MKWVGLVTIWIIVCMTGPLAQATMDKQIDCGYDCNTVHTEDVDMAADSKCSYQMTEMVDGNISFVGMFWAVKELHV